MAAGREDSPEVRMLLRVVLGFFGGLFLSVVSYLTLWYCFDPRREGPPAFAALFGFVLGALAVAFGAFARNPAVRVITWAIAGAGLGDIVLACAAGGLAVGTVLTLSGMVLAVVGAIIGYRTVPPQKNNERLPSV